MKESFQNLQNEDATQKKIKSSIEDSFIRLSVYYKSLSTRRIVESPVYNYQSTLTSLGGAVSLYLGVSFISAFEVAELAAKIFHKQIR